MSGMTDPYLSLISYQEALLNGLIKPQPCKLHSEITLLLDDIPNGKRLTYAYTADSIVKAIAVYVLNGSSGESPYFQVGYAVAEEFRNQGIAKRILEISIDEMKYGFLRIMPTFYIEAVIGMDNLPSQKTAEKVLGGDPEEITDKHSGEPALRYTRHIAK